jgi:hypothetical protein
MPRIPKTRQQEIAEKLAEIFGAVDGIKLAKPEEPRQFAKLPAVSVMDQGFARSNIASPAVEGTGVQDPLGGREWVWSYTVRPFVSLGGDQEEAQRLLRYLAVGLVDAVERNRTLDGLVVEAAIASGELVIIEARQGRRMLAMNCTATVSWTEATPT